MGLITTVMLVEILISQQEQEENLLIRTFQASAEMYIWMLAWADLTGMKTMVHQEILS